LTGLIIYHWVLKGGGFCQAAAYDPLQLFDFADGEMGQSRPVVRHLTGDNAKLRRLRVQIYPSGTCLSCAMSVMTEVRGDNYASLDQASLTYTNSINIRFYPLSFFVGLHPISSANWTTPFVKYEEDRFSFCLQVAVILADEHATRRSISALRAQIFILCP